MTTQNKIRALIADDEAHIRLFIRTVLESLGMAVVAEARNGQEAVTLYLQEKPHISFLDINMPVKTGGDALAEIKAANPDALVVMLTSTTDRQTVEQFVEMGASNFIRKDTRLADMKKIIKETWDEYRMKRKKTDGA